jgi:hypothetical protein
MKLEVKAYGENAKAMLNLVSAFIKSEWKVQPELYEHKEDQPQRDITIGIAILGLTLALPPAIIATLDLIERKKLHAKMKDLQEQIKNLKSSEKDSVQIHIGEVKVINLLTAQSGEVVEALSDEAKREAQEE